MRRLLFSLVPLLALTPAARSIDPADFEERLAAIRVGPEFLRWQEVPWLTSVSDGMKLAKSEKRPMLLWAIDDEPLERC